jgi:hypothetical protein
MAAQRDRYLQLILERIEADHYPSGELMDLAEASFTDPKHVEAYVNVLLEKAAEARYPSKQMLRRIARLAA